MHRIVAVRQNELGEPEVLLAASPGDIGMRAVRVDNGPRTVVARAESMPPGRAEWFRHSTGGPLLIGCADCGQMSMLSVREQRVHIDGKLDQPHGCPRCGKSAMLQLAGFEPVSQGACSTCNHDVHAAECACGCIDDGSDPQPVYKLERTVDGPRIAIAGEAHMQAEAKRIAAKALHRARR